MNLERVLDRLDAKLDAQDERLAEFRGEMHEFHTEVLERLGAMESRIAVLETKQSGSSDGVKALGWILTFCVSLAALGISLWH